MSNEITQIESMIYEIRGFKVMLDSDLASLYGVEVKALNRTVKRHIKRFPYDFMFQLTSSEWSDLKSQFVASGLRCQNGTAKQVEKIRFNPYAFTEQGISMLSGLLNSDIAIEMNIAIMRAFVKLRHYALKQIDTNEQIIELRKMLMLYMENTDSKLQKHEKEIGVIIKALNSLIHDPPPAKEPKQIGFVPNHDKNDKQTK
jgi:hypothetical protein